jgi:WD40 repeat protein
MVYDAQHDMMYISAGSTVKRYHVSSGTMLSAITVGGSLRGIDLSPDGRSIAVADAAVGSDHVFLIDTKSLAVTKLVDPDHGQSFGVAYLPNGDLLVSGFSVQRRSASTGQWTPIISESVGWHEVATPSGDGTRVGIEQSGVDPAEWVVYDAKTGGAPAFGTTAYPEFEITVNHDGSQVAIPTYGGTNVFDASSKLVGTLGQQALSTPIGGAYDPVRPLAYFPWVNSSEIRIYDMSQLKQTGTLDFQTDFSWAGNEAYGNGRTRLSRDGSLLMVTVAGGVRIYRIYAPLSADNETASTIGGQPVAIPVHGSIGVAGTLSYGVLPQPAHGTATVNGSTVTYTPSFSFSGTETFKYQAHYGQAVANGTITVAVSPAPNQPPVAVDDNVNLWSADPASIDVLANDSDPDGQALSIIAVAQPGAGTVAIQGNKLLYTPPASGYAITNFKYTISDGHGGTASAVVYVVVRKIR